MEPLTHDYIHSLSPPSLVPAHTKKLSKRINNGGDDDKHLCKLI